MKHIFGPVPSRRLGLSLGVDVVTRKSCSLNCHYCQVGRTSDIRIERTPYFPVSEIMEELETVLGEAGHIDWITFSGSGEPTLCESLGTIIRSIKKITDIPVALLTNSTLLSDPKLREEIAPVDLVVPSLDAGNERTFFYLNVPHPFLKFDDVIAGLTAFCREYQGRIWLEVMLVKGYNDTPEHILQIATIASQLKPERVQLNTVVRPGACKTVLPLTPGQMDIAREMMYTALAPVPVEIIPSFTGDESERGSGNTETVILDYLKRRPATCSDIAISTGKDPQEVAAVLQQLDDEGKLTSRRLGSETFFSTPGGVNETY